MIEAHLTTASGLLKPVRQPGHQLVIDGERMQVSEHETAVHNRHTWDIGEQRFLVLKISSPVTVHFESESGRSPEFGPFEALWLVDGWMLTNLDEELPLAHFIYEASAWLLTRGDSKWPRVVFTEAESAR